MRIQEFLKEFYHCGMEEILRILLITKAVVDDFFYDFLRGGMSHEQ